MPSGVKKAEEILGTAENIQRIEQIVVTRMEADNKSLVEMLNFFDHYAKVGKKQASKLIFTV